MSSIDTLLRAKPQNLESGMTDKPDAPKATDGWTKMKPSEALEHAVSKCSPLPLGVAEKTAITYLFELARTGDPKKAAAKAAEKLPDNATSAVLSYFKPGKFVMKAHECFAPGPTIVKKSP